MSYPSFWVYEKPGYYVVEFTGEDGVQRRITKPKGPSDDTEAITKALVGEAKSICALRGVVSTSKDVLTELIGETTILVDQMRLMMDEITRERERKWSFRIKRKIASVSHAIRTRFKRGG